MAVQFWGRRFWAFEGDSGVSNIADRLSRETNDLGLFVSYLFFLASSPQRMTRTKPRIQPWRIFWSLLSYEFGSLHKTISISLSVVKVVSITAESVQKIDPNLIFVVGIFLLKKRKDRVRGTGKWLQGNQKPPELNISCYPYVSMERSFSSLVLCPWRSTVGTPSNIPTWNWPQLGRHLDGTNFLWQSKPNVYKDSLLIFP